MIKINRLEAENVKRIRAVKVEPTENGLTIIGGKNAQGKTSVLDAIAWALGGNKFRPSEPKREDSQIPPNLRVIMSNGLIVERKGKNGDLKVTDPDGKKAGQKLLDSFVEELALDLPKFMEASGAEKAKTLLRIIGVEEELAQLEREEQQVYNERRYVGQIADSKQKFANEQPYYPDAPDDIISPSDLINQQQEILARNGRNQEIRQNAESLSMTVRNRKIEIQTKQEQLQRLHDYIREQSEILAKEEEELAIAQKTAEELVDESTAELEESLRKIDEINRKVRANLDKQKAEDDAKEYAEQYQGMTAQLDKIRQTKKDLLNGADLPLPELSVADGELTYKGQRWDCMSSAEQLKVSTAIIRKLKPDCGFILIDKLEAMDLDTLREFGEWLEVEGLQAIATRVSTGDECSVIIEDGYVSGMEKQPDPVKPSTWEGAF